MFIDLVKGSVRSNTVQVNSIILAIWSAIQGSEFVQSNPDIASIMVGVTAVVNLFLRFKTKKPISQR